jgi:pheromone shutdown-related protein TraB|tara:strand:- start:114 stop:800 length:687 start_codon:yes stop_codon:yes gene_type:complete
MKYKHLTLIGTSHISKESMVEVEEAILREKPELVCVELDRKRAYALMHNIKGRISISDIPRIGVKGYLFALLGGWAEKKMGDYVGVSPGDEMKKAMEVARREKTKIAFIDQDIEITLNRLSRALTWGEKWNFVVDLFKGFVLRQKTYQFDLNTVPSKELIAKMIGEVKVRYPNLYRVLVEERNVFMAKKLIKIMKDFDGKPLVAIVGAGHEKEMIDIIKGNSKNIDVV